MRSASAAHACSRWLAARAAVEVTKRFGAAAAMVRLRIAEIPGRSRSELKRAAM